MANMDTAIEVRGDTIRVGSVTRQLIYTDQVTNGWLFEGREVLSEGTWVIKEWPQWKIAQYKRAQKFPFRQLRALMGSRAGEVPAHSHSLLAFRCSFVESKPLFGMKFNVSETDNK